MDILFFSDNSNIEKFFEAVKKPDSYSSKFYKCSELQKTVKKAVKGSLLYVDISGYSAEARKKALNFLSQLDDCKYGIIDPKGVIIDPAGLFHNGAADFIGKELFKKGTSAKRLRAVSEFRPAAPIEDIADEEPAETSYILSGKDWKNVKSGNEYTFCMMFIEMDNQKNMKAKFDADHLKKSMEAFQRCIAEYVSSINGKIWMWMDFGGLVLIPFNGKNCGTAILTAVRLMLYRKIISIEAYEFKTELSYRIALHIGNTVYRSRGDTGTIVSDSINSIFHLGQKYAKPNSFLMTHDVATFIPEGLEEYFMPEGEFEGRSISRMRTLQK